MDPIEHREKTRQPAARYRGSLYCQPSFFFPLLLSRLFCVRYSLSHADAARMGVEQEAEGRKAASILQSNLSTCLTLNLPPLALSLNFDMIPFKFVTFFLSLVKPLHRGLVGPDQVRSSLSFYFSRVFQLEPHGRRENIPSMIFSSIAWTS